MQLKKGTENITELNCPENINLECAHFKGFFQDLENNLVWPRSHSWAFSAAPLCPKLHLNPDMTTVVQEIGKYFG